jgi:NAD kinase
MVDRRISIKPETMFSKPLLIYKITSDLAYLYSLKICSYLIKSDLVDCIFVEDTEKINLENILKNEEEDGREEIYFRIGKNSQNKIIKLDIDNCLPDLCIVIGGDGTTLWANHLFGLNKRPPFLTFNLGTLGYMVIYTCEKYADVIDELYSDKKNVTYEKRALLHCNLYEKSSTGENKIKIWETTALNDIVIERAAGAHMLSLLVYINDEPLTEIKCDGLIFATSTGSTAYSLSAGGSIVHYDVDCIILNAICPHSLSFRPINFPRDIKISIAARLDSGNKAVITHDGINRVHLETTQSMEVSLSDKFINFIVLNKFTENRVNLWKQKLVEQLGWNMAFKNN